MMAQAEALEVSDRETMIEVFDWDPEKEGY